MGDVGFWRRATADPQQLAVITPGGDAVTAGELVAGANRTANALRALGISAGDTVSAVLPNSVELLELYLAALQIGCYFTPINHHLVGPEIGYILDDSAAAVLVGHERFADELVRAVESGSVPPDHRFAVGSVPGFRPLAELSDGQRDTAPEGRSAGTAMHYTSGTTGKPKGVKRALFEIDPDDLAELYTGLQGLFGVGAGDGHVHLTGSPLYHTAVLLWTANSLHLGHTVVLMDRWDPTDMLELIQRHRVTTSHMVPTQFHRLLALPEEVRSRYDVSSLRCMVHAAAPCPPEIKRRMIEWWGDAVYEYYAATEGGGTIIDAQQWMAKPGSVGVAWPGSEIRVRDDEAGRWLPAGEEGTVYMSLALADFEYKGDAAKTDEGRTDGFFTVGDWGYLDDDGYLFLRDRKSDMIISGGVNIYPAEIEGVLLTYPEIDDVAVFGIPDDDWGERIHAVVAPIEGIAPDDALTERIDAFCADKLAKFKRPRSISYTDEMPRDPSGKLYKRKLRDPYWEGRDAKI